MNNDELRRRLNDSYKTGWLAPDGTFIGCPVWEHWILPTILNLTENDLELRGYIKIIGEKPGYVIPRFHITEPQYKYLLDKGFIKEDL